MKEGGRKERKDMIDEKKGIKGEGRKGRETIKGGKRKERRASIKGIENGTK